MKIYNEIITKFNDITGQWETMSEDSFEYNGRLDLLLQGPPNGGANGGPGGSSGYVPVAGGGTGGGVSNVGPTVNPTVSRLAPIGHTILNPTDDQVIDTLKITAGYFTNGDGTLEGSNLYTGSLADSNEKYYYNITQTHPNSSSVASQFSVTYGHIAGSGSDTKGGTANATTLKGESEAIYEQFTNVLLASSEISGGFKISQQGTNGVKSSGQKDEDIFVLVGKRERFKDRINKKNWTITLKGYPTNGGVSAPLTRYFTDDSVSVAAATTPAGPRHNIVSGAAGSVVGTGAIADKTYGWFYPDMGMLVFSAAELSASIPGPGNTANITASFVQNPLAGSANAFSSSGFAVNTNNNNDCKNALRFINCLKNVGSSTNLRFRSEEDQTQVNYFCRVKAKEYNHSNNPTFGSGSLNEIRNKNMWGNPTVFISGVGLYNAAGQLVATAQLSSPIKKNFSSEATIKVKLTY